MRYLSILILTILLIPGFTYAAVNPPSNFADFVNNLVDIIQLFIYLLFALSFIVFMWGVVKSWVFNGGDAKSVEEGRKLVFAGLIGLVIMFSVWGIVAIMQTTFFG